MATITFTGSGEFIVPADNSSVTVRLYGGAGEDGTSSSSGRARDDSSNGSNGGYVEGTLPVSPGDRLYPTIGGGGVGKSGSVDYDGNGSASAGDGGDAASIRYGNTDVASVVAAAGGGGGGAACASAPTFGDEDDAYSETSGSGAGGGAGEDGPASNVDNHDSAEGGGSGSFSGGTGRKSTSSYGGDLIACSGGGGGGYNGGEAGDSGTWYTVHNNTNSTSAGAYAGGGAGGDGDASGLSNSTVTVGGHTGVARVEIDYTATPRAPSLNQLHFNAEVPEINLTWNLDSSITDGYNIYRARNSGFTTDFGTRIASINSYSTQSYTDSNVSRGNTYYYIVTALNSETSSESDDSNEENVLLAARIKVYENGSWVSYPLKVWDGSAWAYPKSINAWNGNTSQWDIESNR